MLLLQLNDRRRIPFGLGTTQQHVETLSTELSVNSAGLTANHHGRVGKPIAGSRAALERRRSVGDDRVAVVALGAYGRRELTPRTEVEVLFLHSGELNSDPLFKGSTRIVDETAPGALVSASEQASHVVVGGRGVKGGRVYGKWPGLGQDQLYEGRDLAVTTDFRDVFGVDFCFACRVPLLANGIQASLAFQSGKIYLIGGLGPDGKPIGRIDLPERCANVCFGGAKRNRLFMAASQSLYAVYTGTQGAAPG